MYTQISKQLEEAIAAPVTEGSGWDGKRVGSTWRLQWSRATWHLEELPTKGGPRKLRVGELVNPLYPSLHGTREGDAFLPENILQDAKLLASDSYDKVKEKLTNAMNAALELAHKNPKLSWVKIYPWGERSRGAVMVTPEGVEPVEVKGKDFSLTSKFDKFSVFSPGSTMNYAPDGEPHYTEIVSKSAGAARKLYNMVKQDPKLMANVAWKDIDAWFRKNGISFDYNFSQW